MSTLLYPDRKTILPAMVLVPAGAFNRGNDEKKQIVQLTQPFLLARYPVTQAQWRAVMGSDPPELYFKGKDHNPVESVNWFEAVAFCNKLSKLAGLGEAYSIKGENIELIKDAKGYRLPTEAEWEYAARGGPLSNGYEYAGSNDLDEVGWYGGNSNDSTQPVGQKKPNELGLFDMSGNVWEWCWDWYNVKYYAESPEKNPKGPEKGSDRVLRGGSWYSSADSCRTADRGSGDPSYRINRYGFRVCSAPQ